MRLKPGNLLAADRRPITGLLTANTISQIGNEFSYLAIPWFVLATTGSASQTGITVAVGVVPMILVGIFGGAIVDRLGYKQSSMVSDVLSGLSVLAIPLLHQTVGIAFWQLLALVFLGAVLDGPGRTARMALFPELVHRVGLDLDRSNAGYQTTSRIAELLTPPLAGVLIAVMGAGNLLWLNAASFLLSTLVVARFVPAIAPSATAAPLGGLRGYLGEVKEGFRFVFGKPVLVWMTLSFAIGSLVAEPLYAVILPVYANQEWGSAVQLGFTFSALGAGSLIGNGVYVALSHRLSRGRLLIGGFAIRAVAFSVMITMPEWWLVAIAVFIGAVALEPINPMTMSVLQEQVPSGMRGRVFGARGALQSSTLPIGIVVYGFLMSSLGLRGTLVVFVVLNLALPLLMASSKVLRTIPRASPAKPVAAFGESG
ncbi:MAG: MFS transporter [Chloroflexia bacterium]|nr:MFS transporter [Chloroflexia bacterium]